MRILLAGGLSTIPKPYLVPRIVATATVDRQLHRAYTCRTSGESVSLTKPSPEKGDAPELTLTMMAALGQKAIALDTRPD